MKRKGHTACDEKDNKPSKTAIVKAGKASNESSDVVTEVHNFFPDHIILRLSSQKQRSVGVHTPINRKGVSAAMYAAQRSMIVSPTPGLTLPS